MRKLHTKDTSTVAIRKARALYYDFFARVLMYDLLLESRDVLVSTLKLMQQSPLDESVITSYNHLLTVLQTDGLQPFKYDYTELFVMPHAHTKVHLILSHYVDNSVAGSILLDIRQFFRQLPVRINSDNCKESEEHFGFLMLLSSYILENDSVAYLHNEFFQSFIIPFGMEIARALQKAPSQLYQHVGLILEQFLLFEQDCM